jgi:excisionase family DNA binding protein
MNKQEAAEFLGVSPRQIERYIKENRIGVRFEKGRTKPTPIYDESELRRFKEELERPVHRPAVQRMGNPMESASNEMPTQSDGALSLLSQPSQFEALVRLVEAIGAHSIQAPGAVKLAASVQDIALKLMLSVEEAAIYSGLSKGAIDEAIRAGKLAAHKGKWRGRRVKRADVEKLIAKL